ncbi:hypothetical protein [Wenyingzhuangia aestuarii]|uniref:hypothetical protein n=1 Tax=Wenyingzhuangia aestuarii TaxID=1647582 RepID=UPI00143B7025|nr:hypothetical protein [Wenyingzhuangia aestuarii]NJB81934.1 hypothetical protein [Wenyingzhuangia aestuarii]
MKKVFYIFSLIYLLISCSDNDTGQDNEIGKQETSIYGKWKIVRYVDSYTENGVQEVDTTYIDDFCFKNRDSIMVNICDTDNEVFLLQCQSNIEYWEFFEENNKFLNTIHRESTIPAKEEGGCYQYKKNYSKEFLSGSVLNYDTLNIKLKALSLKYEDLEINFDTGYSYNDHEFNDDEGFMDFEYYFEGSFLILEMSSEDSKTIRVLEREI